MHICFNEHIYFSFPENLTFLKEVLHFIYHNRSLYHLFAAAPKLKTERHKVLEKVNRSNQTLAPLFVPSVPMYVLRSLVITLYTYIHIFCSFFYIFLKRKTLNFQTEQVLLLTSSKMSRFSNFHSPLI